MGETLVLHEFVSDWDHDGSANKLRTFPLDLTRHIFDKGVHSRDRSPTLQRILCCSPLCQNEWNIFCRQHFDILLGHECVYKFTLIYMLCICIQYKHIYFHLRLSIDIFCWITLFSFWTQSTFCFLCSTQWGDCFLLIINQWQRPRNPL